MYGNIRPQWVKHSGPGLMGLRESLHGIRGQVGQGQPVEQPGGQRDCRQAIMEKAAPEPELPDANILLFLASMPIE